MWIKRASAISGIENTKNIPVNPDDYFAWKNGHGNIQDVMPYLSDSDREFILSGIIDEEWEDIFQGSEEEDMYAEDEPAF